MTWNHSYFGNDVYLKYMFRKLFIVRQLFYIELLCFPRNRKWNQIVVILQIKYKKRVVKLNSKTDLMVGSPLRTPWRGEVL